MSEVEGIDGYSRKTPFSVKVKVDIDLIDPNPYQPRFNPQGANLDKLKENVKALGFTFEPIIVHKKKDGRFELIDGERRWRSAKDNGDKKIEALVYTDLTTKDIMNIIISSFNQKEGINPIEEAMFYKKALDDRIFRNDSELAKRQGVSPKYVSARLAILNLPYDVQEAVKTKDYTNVEVLLKLGSFINKYIKRELIKVKRENKRVMEEDEVKAKDLAHDEALALFEMIRSDNLTQKEAINLIDEALSSNSDLPRVIKQSWGIYNEKGSKIKFDFDTKKLPDDKKQSAMEHIKALKELLGKGAIYEMVFKFI